MFSMRCAVQLAGSPLIHGTEFVNDLDAWRVSTNTHAGGGGLLLVQSYLI